MKWKIISSLVCCLISIRTYAGFQPAHLTCDYKINPLGNTSPQPRLAWWITATTNNVQQTAYQISLTTEDREIWNSGKQYTASNAAYLSIPLASGQKYRWRVRVWDQHHTASPWSPWAEWVTGIKEEWKEAKWIAYEALGDIMKVIPGAHGNGDALKDKMQQRAVNPYLKKAFRIIKPVKAAYVFISGLGQYELYLNGRKVSNDFLTPGWTNYEKRCLYNTYDVTNELKAGENVIGSLLGAGFFYINRERYRKFTGGFGYPMLRAILRLRYNDNSIEDIVTDESWKTSPSPITFTSIYGGEDYDARLEQPDWCRKDDPAWRNAVIVNGPGGKMAPQLEYPLKVMDTIFVKSIHGNVYDFGQNASGMIALKVKGKRGDTIRLKPSELLDNQRTSGGPYYFEYILKGNGTEEWMPRFTYYGFRYVTIEGNANVESMRFLHTRNSAPATGSFTTSDTLFNRIYQLIDWSIRSNIASVSTDCPHREKMGWLEQAHLMGESLQYTYKAADLYNKITDDIMEAQLPDGMVPSVAPEYTRFEGPFRDDPGYGSAAVLVPWYLYKWYGDKNALVKAYDMMQRYVSYLGTKAEANILQYGLGDWLDAGPNEPGISQLTPVALTATAFWYRNVVLMGKIAAILDRDAEALQYNKKGEEIKAAFLQKFYNERTGVYGTGSQTSYAVPIYMGLTANKETALQQLKDSILAQDKIITAGDIGHRFLVQALQENGASQLVFDMNNRTDVPGYGQQIKNGGTALAEHWKGAGVDWLSQNHMIFGHLMEWFYNGLAGIRQQEGDYGYKQLLIAPQIVAQLQWVKAQYLSENGPVEVYWEKKKNGVQVNISIPPNTTANVVLPNKKSIHIYSGKHTFLCAN